MEVWMLLNLYTFSEIKDNLHKIHESKPIAVQNKRGVQLVT